MAEELLRTIPALARVLRLNGLASNDPKWWNSGILIGALDARGSEFVNPLPNAMAVWAPEGDVVSVIYRMPQGGWRVDGEGFFRIPNNFNFHPSLMDQLEALRAQRPGDWTALINDYGVSEMHTAEVERVLRRSGWGDGLLGLALVAMGLRVLGTLGGLRG